MLKEFTLHFVYLFIFVCDSLNIWGDKEVFEDDQVMAFRARGKAL